MKVLGFLLSLLMGVLLFFFIVYVFGGVTGEEFSTAGFQRRTFAYKEIPLLHIQFTAIKRRKKTNPLSAHLLKQKYLTPVSGQKVRWDLVRSDRVKLASPLCDSRILCAYLDQTDHDGKLVWKKWSKKNPKLAGVLWPALENIAQQHLYFLTPELIDLAKTAKDQKPFQNQIRLLLAEKYDFLASTQQQLSKHENAVRWFTEALKHDPGRQSSLQGRAKSYDVLGRSEEADEDRKSL